MNTILKKLRREYSDLPLLEQNVEREPIEQFRLWFHDAVRAKIREPHAMTISTVDRQKRPTSRIVLMKYFGKDGFAFVTSYASQKATQLRGNSAVALNFFWADLERQVRITGTVKKASGAVSEKFFKARPRGSQIGAHLFPQSAVIESRAAVEKRYKEMLKLFGNKAVPRPSTWGAYIIVPDYFEFWQGRKNRLHDRICYQKIRGRWVIKRLAP